MLQRWHSPAIRQLFVHLRGKQSRTFVARTGSVCRTNGSCSGASGGPEKSKHDLSFGDTPTLLASKRVPGSAVKGLARGSDEDEGAWVPRGGERSSDADETKSVAQGNMGKQDVGGGSQERERRSGQRREKPR